MGTNILGIIKGSPTMMVLLVLSIFVCTIILERFLYLKRSQGDTSGFMNALSGMIKGKAFEDAIRYCEQQKKPLTNVLKIAIMNRNLSKEDVEELMISSRLEEKVKFEKFLVFLGSVGTIGPLLGLLGTVAGLSRAFKDLALSGSAGPSVVAAGISEALYATITGLAIAIPTVLLYNYLMGLARKLNTEIEINSKKMLVWLFETAK